MEHSAPPPLAPATGGTASWPPRVAAHLLGVGLTTATLIALPSAPSDLDRFQLPKETVMHLTVLLAVLLVRPLPVRTLRPAARLGLGLLVAATIVAGFGAVNGWLAFRAVALTVSIVAALLVARRLGDLGESPVLLAWCTVAAVVGAATGLAQAYGARSPLFALVRIPGGTFGNRNFMAHVAALGLPLLLYGVLAARRRAVWLLAIAGATAAVAAVVLSRSRTAWLGALVGVVLVGATLAMAHRQQRFVAPVRRLLLLGAALAGGTIAAVALPNHLSWRSSSPYTDTLARLADSQDGSGRGRLLQYRNSLRLAEAHPWFGVGPANWPLRYPEVAPPNDPSWSYGDPIPFNPWPSSDWIALVAERGLFGVAAVVLLGIAVTWRGVVAARRDGAPLLAGAALLALLGVLLVEGMFDAVLLLPVPALLVAMATGALLAEVDPAPPMPTPARAGWMNAVLLVLLALGAARSCQQTAAYVVAGSGASTARLTWAARLDPTSYAIRVALARRLPCSLATPHIRAAAKLAPEWPAPVAEAHRCNVSLQRAPHSAQLPS